LAGAASGGAAAGGAGALGPTGAGFAGVGPGVASVGGNALGAGAAGSAAGAGSALSALGPTGSGFAGTGPGVASAGGNALGAGSAGTVGGVAGGVGNAGLTMNNPTGGALNAAGGSAVVPGTGTIASGATNAGAGVAGASGLSQLSGSGTNNLGSGLTGSGLTDNLAILGSSLASGALSYNATEKGIEENRRQYDQTREDFEPWRQAGIQGLGQYQDRLNQPVPEFQFKLEDDPIYQFQLAESQKATERGMAARGYNNSGNVLQELSRDAIGQAGKYQDQAYNRQLGTSQTNYGRNLDRTNQYGNLAGVGQTATQSVSAAGQNSTNNLQNLYLQQGQGLNNSIQGGLNNYLLNNYLRR